MFKKVKYLFSSTMKMLYITIKEVVHFLLGWILIRVTSENVCPDCIQIFTLWFEGNVVKPYLILPDILIIRLPKEAAHHGPVSWSDILSFCSVALRQDYGCLHCALKQVCTCCTSRSCQTGVSTVCCQQACRLVAVQRSSSACVRSL